MKSWILVLATTLIAGCATGIRSDGSSPSVTYTVPHNYQVVYMRARHQASECQGSQTALNKFDSNFKDDSIFKVESTINPDMQSGVVSVQDPITGTEVARTTLKAVDAKHTEITQVVSGNGSWNHDALNAMQQSVRMDTSVCFVYK